MKIALVIDRFLPQKGGGERYVHMIAQQLAQKGHTVTILSSRFPKPPSPNMDIHYRPISSPHWPGFLKILVFAKRCKQETERGNFDVVHDVGHMVGADIFNPHGGVEQVWLKRYFASYANPFHRTFKKAQRLFSPREWALFFLQKRQYRSPETRCILAISPMILNHIQQCYPEIPKDKLTEIPNPAELARFSPQNRSKFRRAQRNLLHLKEGEIALLFAGNNFRLKGLYPLLESLNALKDLSRNGQSFHLLIAGSERPNRWQRIAKKLGVQHLTTFLGPVKEIEKIYAASDIFVLPTFYDSASLVVLEALASGLPVITSRWNGAHSLIDVPTTGMVLERNDDPVEIAKALYTYFPEEMREKALSASPAQVNAISLKDHVERLLELYSNVIRLKTHG